ncbi:ABC transporter ATP-binding protein [Streptomyces sp. DSM 110735]|uniref:ABC transporter ATP-binding protein n=1 Tax=Streptomyces sp. DSM 110735 TaxID=2775031 RepID=UPI0027DDD117|nr:ABC transporter ATP-binding protein [Streptomyces sp. DSM 110735]
MTAEPLPVAAVGPAPLMRLVEDQPRDQNLIATARRLPAVLARVLRLAWHADRRALLAMLAAQTAAAVLSAVALTTTTTLIAALLDAAAAYGRSARVGPAFHAAAAPAVWVTAALAGAALCDTAARAAAARLSPRVFREADLRVLDAAASVELIAYEHPGFEDRLDAAGRGAESSRDLVLDLQSSIAVVAQLVAIAAVTATLNPVLVLLLLATAIPRAYASLRAARLEHAAVTAARSDSRLRTTLRGYSTDRNTAAEIRAAGMGGFLSTRYRQVSDRLETEALSAAVRGLRVQLLGETVSALTLCGTFAALGALVATGRLEAAAAGTALFALRAATAALTTLTRAARRIFRTGLHLEDWAAFLDEADQHRTHRGSRPLPDDGPHIISARGLTFRYPGSERVAVDQVNFDLKRGEIVAVVGENGSGKTTLVHLLTGLYLPDAGHVAWDGVNLADVPASDVWRRVAMTPQEYTRWPLTARENITLGAPRTGDDEAVLDAAHASGADHVLDTLPDGLDTSLARSWWGGHDLSGGQWQRVALARSFYADAVVHILDEPTSALDARGERQVFDTFRALASDRAALFITHRLANARLADRIVVMKDGRISEEGTYQELLNSGGLFAELHHLQEGDADAEAPGPTRR